MTEWEQVREQRLDHGVVRTIVTDRGRAYTYFDCDRRLRSAWHGTCRWFSRTLRARTTWDDADMNAHEIERLRWLLDDMRTYVEIVARELDRIEGVDRRAERVRKLRAVAGRTPEEAAAYLAKADQLEGGS